MALRGQRATRYFRNRHRSHRDADRSRHVVRRFSNLVFVGSAVWSLGIWSSAEGFGLPWNESGITDLGPSVGYIFASLALLLAFGGAAWSLDSRFRPEFERFGWLCSWTPAGIMSGEISIQPVAKETVTS